MILATLRAMWLDLSRDWVRNQLDYLESRKLVLIERHAIKPWHAKLTRYGWDVATWRPPTTGGFDEDFGVLSDFR